jgi:5-methylthioadenosine/S-adenosylhomocysteine deaminase
MTLFRGLAPDLPLNRWLTQEIWPRERKLTAKHVYWFSLLGLAEMIRSGTTAFVDMYFFMDEVAKAVEESGARALLSSGIIAPTPDRIEPELKKAEALVREWEGAADGRIRTAFAPHAPYTCPPEVWRQVTALARELKVPIHTHLAEMADEVTQIRAETGRCPAEWLEEMGVFSVPVIAAHCVHVSEKDIEILAAHGATAAHCPTSNLRLACGIAPVQEMLQGGVNVALGTDGAGSAGDLNMVEEMRLAAVLAKQRAGDPEVLPPSEALRCATSRGAIALGLGKELGTIEPGRRADGVLVSMKGPHLCPGHDPRADLVYAAQGSDVGAVFVDGRPLLLGGELQTLDGEEIVARCRQLARRFR